MKTATKSTKTPAATKAATATHPPLEQQPQSKNQAAVQSGMFLHTDDQWSLAYFNSNDLHCEEREFFA
jgi:hypothetical protein